MSGSTPSLSIMLTALLLASCSADTTEPGHLVASAAPLANARWSDWSSPDNIGEPLNSAQVEQGPSISRDGLSMYFHCIGCPGGFGAADIWVSRRAGVDDPWGTPRNLGPTINTSAGDGSPNLSSDGHWLFFGSTRAGGFGSNDLYVSRRHDKNDDFGWQPPVNLGPNVNTAASDNGAATFETVNGGLGVYFASGRAGGMGGNDVYLSVRGDDEAFGPAVLVPELSTSFNDQGPTVSRDGLEVIFPSNRTGTLGDLDLWRSTRRSLNDAWSVPENMGPGINSEFIDAGAELSFDGTTLFFHSPFREGSVGGPFFDIWYVTRSRLRGAP
ncbi:MAG: hypothetical protein ACREOK_02040 [Gemmatimonadaceae bacterium]